MAQSYPTVNSLKNKLVSLLAEGKAKRVFSGASAGISFSSQQGRKKVLTWAGKTSFSASYDDLQKKTLFDLASLTKPLATTLAILSLISKKRIQIDENLGSLLESQIGYDKREIKLLHLLNHCSGLAPYKAFYKYISDSYPEEKKKDIIEDILSSPLLGRPGSLAEYSDLGFILLGRIVEIKSGKSLDRYLGDEVLMPLGLEERLVFNPFEKILHIDPLDFAATEHCPWRRKVIRGEVHDENTFFTGGVSGQAGLFGDAEALLMLADFLLEMWKGRRKHPHIADADIQHFFEVPAIVKSSSWALGFDTPSPHDSSAGRYLSRKSVGHLGFTGTSFWIDPQRELVIVLLTNRIHPSRKNTGIREFRPFFHDHIVGLFP